MSKDQCPPLYAQGLFIRAFGEAYFVKHFDWLLRRDPNLGNDSYGQTLRLYIERCFVMQRDLDSLADDDGWKSRSEFKACVGAIKRIPDLNEKQHADSRFFADAPACFFREYNNMFHKHVSTAVRSSDILIYLVGGNPILARMLLQWLKCAEDDEIPLTSYVFESITISLRHQESDTNEVISVDSRKCMEYLTELVDVKAMLRDTLLGVHKDLWWKMSFTGDVVDLFDSETWSTVDYEPLVDLVHQKNAPHALHQQRCKKHLQMAALTASNNVGEGRRSY